jgi:hypothetical protein
VSSRDGIRTSLIHKNPDTPRRGHLSQLAGRNRLGSARDLCGARHMARCVGRVVSAVRRMSQGVRRLLQRVRREVQTIRRMPQRNGRMPQRVRRLPQAVRRVQQTIRRVQQTIRRVPQMGRRVPQTVRRSLAGSPSIAAGRRTFRAERLTTTRVPAADCRSQSDHHSRAVRRLVQAVWRLPRPIRRLVQTIGGCERGLGDRRRPVDDHSGTVGRFSQAI